FHDFTHLLPYLECPQGTNTAQHLVLLHIYHSLNQKAVDLSRQDLRGYTLIRLQDMQFFQFASRSQKVHCIKIFSIKIPCLA
ncbi:unnamed protein product, partial [Linum tenue]